MNTVELESLVGMHVLSGVDRVTVTTGISECKYAHESWLNFVLDGKVYSAMEDYNDGYRSAMDALLVSEGTLGNMFEPVGVLGVMREDSRYCECEVLDLYDVANGKIVLSVGTDNVDDWYPCFVAEFEPRNLHVNE